jgi:hypothetical protein
MYSKQCLYSERDLQIPLFIWNWKVVTTSAIHKRFFNNLLPRSAYARLKALEEGGFIVSKRTDRSGLNYWTLGKRGFKLARTYLPELRSEGYLSPAPEHDLIVSAVMLGDWINNGPANASLVSEQQLRNYHPDLLPDWFSDFGRISDGFWRIRKEGHPPLTVAVEVELSQQSRTHYHDLAHRYGYTHWIDRVVWVASTETHARSLNRYLSEVSQYRDTNIHNILTLNEFKKLGWRAPLKYGSETGKTISDLLGCKTDGKALENGPKVDLPTEWRSLIDGRKCPVYPRL